MLEIPSAIEGRAPERKRKETVLDIYDRFVLEKGLRRLKQWFQEIPEDEFPDTLVFLETSSRPLVYAVRPLMEAAAQDRGLPVPSVQFMQTFRRSAEDDEHAFHRQDAEYVLEDPDADEEAKEHAQQELHEIEEDIAYMWRNDPSYSALAERAGELVGQSKTKHALLIDDFANEGGSLQVAKEAFQQIPEPLRPELKAFVFCAATYGRSLEWHEEMFGSDDFKVTLGSLASDGKAAGFGEFTGFSYGKGDSMDPSALTGVEKNLWGSKYVKRAIEVDRTKMLGLRLEMKAEAEKILQERSQ